MDTCAMRQTLEKMWLEDKWTFVQLADCIGVTRFTIAGFITENRVPKQKTLRLIERFIQDKRDGI